MRTKKGRVLHSKGRILPSDGQDWRASGGYAEQLTAALRREARSQRAAAKVFMRWTGASERTVKAWLSGLSMPSAVHLIDLVRYSDEVFIAMLGMANRQKPDQARGIAELRQHLAAASAILGGVEFRV